MPIITDDDETNKDDEDDDEFCNTSEADFKVRPARPKLRTGQQLKMAPVIFI